MRTILFLFLTIIFLGCASHEVIDYPFKSLPIENLGLSCSNETALHIAKIAALEKYPSAKKKLNKHNFSNFVSTYSGRDEEYAHQYHLKAIFQYYPRGNPEFGKYFIESLTVSLTKECKIINVQYVKGLGQLIIN